MSVPANVDVVRQGDPGDMFYVVESGTADVLVDGFVVGVLDHVMDSAKRPSCAHRAHRYRQVKQADGAVRRVA